MFKYVGLIELTPEGRETLEKAPEYLEKFYRLDADMTRGVGGSGLGLYISREIVEQMGGILSVRSQRGTGSTFTVSLPRVAEPSAVPLRA